MEQIVRRVSMRMADLIGVVLISAVSSGAAWAESDTERAFRERRLDMLRAQDPDRIRIDRPQPGPQAPAQSPTYETETAAPSEVGGDAEVKPRATSLSVSASDLAAVAGAKTKHEPGILDFWFEGRYQPYEASDAATGLRDGDLSVMYAGTTYKMGPDIMVGALTQFDRSNELGASSRSGLDASGWMTGPYASVRFGPGVVFDGRAAWGTSQTGGSYLDNESAVSDRRLVRGTLRGSKPLGSWTFAPTVGMSYIEDAPRASSVTTLGGEAPSKVSQGRLEVMPEVKRRFNVDEKTFIEPRAAAGGFLAFDDMSKLGGLMQFSEAVPDMQMKAEAGVSMGVKDGLNMQALGGVESGNATNPETWTGRFQLNMPLGK